MNKVKNLVKYPVLEDEHQVDEEHFSYHFSIKEAEPLEKKFVAGI